MSQPDLPRIVVAGGGVAGLEACLALRAFLGDGELAIDLLCPDTHFEYRALAVLEPFDGPPAWGMPLERFAADQDVTLIRDTLAAVDASERLAIPAGSAPLRYDALLVCVGARTVRSVRGAITFRGPRDGAALRAALDAVAPGERATIAFTAPVGAAWTMPLYELALLAAARLRSGGTRARVVLASPEAAPLQAFGTEASAAVARLLAEHGVDFVGAVRPLAADAGELELDDGRRIRAKAIIALPGLVGTPIRGLPQDAAGFIVADEHGRVDATERLYAAGDAIAFPVKQGGLAAQQADAAAEAALAELGFPIVPRPFDPVLRGVLYTDGPPAYLRAVRGKGAAPRAYSMWWPPSKIAGRHLGPYLCIRAGAPRAPEVRPDAPALELGVDVRAVAGALDPSAVAPG